MKIDQIGKVNKATAAVVSGALVTLIGAFVPLDQEAVSAAQTVITALLVWAVPNDG